MVKILQLTLRPEVDKKMKIGSVVNSQKNEVL